MTGRRLQVTSNNQLSCDKQLFKIGFVGAVEGFLVTHGTQKRSDWKAYPSWETKKHPKTNA